jgi:hypothetical protein
MHSIRIELTPQSSRFNRSAQLKRDHLHSVVPEGPAALIRPVLRP